MNVSNFKECEEIKVEEVAFRGKMLEVKGTGVRWFSRCGKDESGNPEYGLRYFTIQPGGEIPIHDHFYHQTMYFLAGKAECRRFDPKTEDIVEKKITGPGDFVYVPSMEVHGMKNIGDEPLVFLCCIANVYEKK